MSHMMPPGFPPPPGFATPGMPSPGAPVGVGAGPVDPNAYVSLFSEDFSKGGLWPEGDSGEGIIVGAAYVTGQVFGKEQKYKTDKPTTVLVLNIRPIDGGDDEEDLISFGDATRMYAAPDGSRLIPTSTAIKGLTAGSNGATWCELLEKGPAGLGKEGLRPLMMNIRTVVGWRCHFLRIPQQQRNNLPSRTGEKKSPPTILIINKVLAVMQQIPPQGTKIAPMIAAGGPPMADVPGQVVGGAAPVMAPAMPTNVAPFQPPAAPPPMSAPTFAMPTTPAPAPQPAANFQVPPTPMMMPPGAQAVAPAPIPQPVAAPPAPAPGGPTPVDQQTAQFLYQALQANQGAIVYQNLPMVVNAHIPASMGTERGAILQRLIAHDFLKSLAPQVSFDGQTVRLG